MRKELFQILSEVPLFLAWLYERSNGYEWLTVNAQEYRKRNPNITADGIEWLCDHVSQKLFTQRGGYLPNQDPTAKELEPISLTPRGLKAAEKAFRSVGGSSEPVSQVSVALAAQQPAPSPDKNDASLLPESVQDILRAALKLKLFTAASRLQAGEIIKSLKLGADPQNYKKRFSQCCKDGWLIRPPGKTGYYLTTAGRRLAEQLPPSSSY